MWISIFRLISEFKPNRKVGRCEQLKIETIFREIKKSAPQQAIENRSKPRNKRAESLLWTCQELFFAWSHSNVMTDGNTKWIWSSPVLLLHSPLAPQHGHSAPYIRTPISTSRVLTASKCGQRCSPLVLEWRNTEQYKPHKSCLEIMIPSAL